ncbi:MAG: hypothetical protein A4E44_02185 [Methanosaeta sp. PtaB.Bin018]|nr:MAG: hypothetical protein A4E44_02185 [Methanosaeta sp. PtaB.Bin018]
MLNDDQLITLTAGQFRDAVSYAVEKAIQPLHARVCALEDNYVRQKEESAALAATQSTLSENQLIQLRLINELRDAARKKPQPTQRDRVEVLRALLVADGGKMLAKDARKRMHLSKERFSELLKICSFVETKPLHSDKRNSVIILKSELVPRNY